MSSSSLPSEELILRGTVTRVTFANEENGYVVFKINSPTHGGEVTAVGNALSLHKGASVLLRGGFVLHPKFGKQFRFSSLTEASPESSNNLVSYLSSGIAKGIGERTAQKLVDQFGERTIEIICQESERLEEIPGLNKAKIEVLREALSTQNTLRETVRFLAELGLGQAMSMRVYEKLGTKTVETVKRNPYSLAGKSGVRGIGFLTADSMASKLGIRADSRERLAAGLVYTLEKAADEGHTYLPDQMLSDRARILLSLEPHCDLEDALSILIATKAVERSDRGVHLPELLAAERELALWLSVRCEPKSTPLVDSDTATQLLAESERKLKITFSAGQRQAVLDATTYPLLCITGGPGCGKTTIVQALVHLCNAARKRCALVAPTGRAAQRMALVAGSSASTIHRLLRFDPNTGGFIHGVNDPIPYDVVIVDESSMVDLLLARDLIRALPLDCHVIFVGDKDQLPSVGPGRVFAEILSLAKIRCATLTRLFRQAEGSLITEVAHRINGGIVPEIPTQRNAMTPFENSDVHFIECESAEHGAEQIESLVASVIPNALGYKPHEIAVLTPSNKGPIGTKALNARLQARLNPRGGGEHSGSGSLFNQEITLMSGELFRVGDRVCQRVNNYQIDKYGVFNGDTGVISYINPQKKELTVELWDGRMIDYHGNELGQLGLAYCVTVHRSQGSEFPCVVLALHESFFPLLERQLIYTAVTRAKKNLIIVGTKKALSLAVKRTRGSTRLTIVSKLFSDQF